jgi:hypothetical protein
VRRPHIRSCLRTSYRVPCTCDCKVNSGNCLREDFPQRAACIKPSFLESRWRRPEFSAERGAVCEEMRWPSPWHALCVSELLGAMHLRLQSDSSLCVLASSRDKHILTQRRKVAKRTTKATQ